MPNYPLDATGHCFYPSERTEGWMAAWGGKPREESPDSMKQRCRVTPGRGDPTESATENRPPAGPAVRQGISPRG